MSRIEELLEHLLSGETVNFEPRSRAEAYLKNCCNACGCEGLPTPRSRLDALLYALAEKLAGGGGGGSADGGNFEITNAGSLFDNNARLDIMDDLIKCISEECTSFSYMFNNCDELTSIPEFDTGNGTDFTYMFAHCDELTSIPEFDTGNGTTFNSMFYRCASLISIPELDFSNGRAFSSMFYYCEELTSIPELDTRNGTDFYAMFYGCSKLSSILKLDLKKASNNSYIFRDCSKLTHLYLYNIKNDIQIGSGSSYGHLLTVDSLVHTIKELCTVTVTKTLTMGSANLEKIANLYCKITDVTHEKKTMELCESTDEGAMTLTQYASEKGWQIK